MAKILVTPQQLDEIGQQFMSASERNHEMAKKLRGLVDGLQGQWEGVSQERFYQSYNDAHLQLDHVSGMLKEVADELMAIATRFRTVDENKN